MFVPDRLHAVLRVFPRHRGAAVVLTLFNTVWVAIMVYHTSLGRFEPLKPLIVVLAPATFVATINYMEELLAPRMLGGTLLLLAAPGLHLIRWHDSPWRLVVTVTMYVLIIWSMILMLSPYRFRHTVEWIYRVARVPVFGLLFALGVAIGVLTVMVY